MEITTTAVGPPAATKKEADPAEQKMREAADAFEAMFLSQMLESAGLGKSPEGFGGGVGEEQFSSFLIDEQAKAMVKAGGIGLAETIFNAMKAHANG